LAAYQPASSGPPPERSEYGCAPLPLTAHDCPSAPAATAAADPNRIKVFSQPDDNKYHTAACPKLGSNRTSMTLEEAGKKLWPCPICKPPIRQRTTS